MQGMVTPKSLTTEPTRARARLGQQKKLQLCFMRGLDAQEPTTGVGRVPCQIPLVVEYMVYVASKDSAGKDGLHCHSSCQLEELARDLRHHASVKTQQKVEAARLHCWQNSKHAQITKFWRYVNRRRNYVELECDKNLFGSTANSLETRQWQNVLGLDRDAQNLLEPILQYIMVKEKERREAHLHEIKNAPLGSNRDRI